MRPKPDHLYQVNKVNYLCSYAKKGRYCDVRLNCFVHDYEGEQHTTLIKHSWLPTSIPTYMK